MFFPDLNLWARIRAGLLAANAFIQKKLKAATHNLVFLAVDVVGSTKMKVGEDPLDVEEDFKAYRKIVKEVIEKQGAVSSSWTPDGVMICFEEVDAAVAAAQNLIIALIVLNENKLTDRPFQVRCGVNAGAIYYDPAIDSTPLAEIASRVIDVAGHMQKHAQPNSIMMAKEVLPLLSRKTGFHPTHIKVDGFDTVQWGGPKISPSADDQ